MDKPFPLVMKTMCMVMLISEDRCWIILKLCSCKTSIQGTGSVSNLILGAMRNDSNVTKFCSGAAIYVLFLLVAIPIAIVLIFTKKRIQTYLPILLRAHHTDNTTQGNPPICD